MASLTSSRSSFRVLSRPWEEIAIERDMDGWIDRRERERERERGRYRKREREI